MDFGENFEDMINFNQINKIKNNKGNSNVLKNEIFIRKNSRDNKVNEYEIKEQELVTPTLLNKKRKKPNEKKKSCLDANGTNNGDTTLDNNYNQIESKSQNQKVEGIIEICYKKDNFSLDRVLKHTEQVFKNADSNFTKPNAMLQRIYSSVFNSNEKNNTNLNLKKELSSIKLQKSEGTQSQNSSMRLTFDTSLRNSYAKTLSFISNFKNDYTAISLQKDSEKYNEDEANQTHFIKKKQTTSNIKRKCGVSYVKQSESTQLNVEDKYEYLYYKF